MLDMVEGHESSTGWLCDWVDLLGGTGRPTPSTAALMGASGVAGLRSEHGRLMAGTVRLAVHLGSCFDCQDADGQADAGLDGEAETTPEGAAARRWSLHAEQDGERGWLQGDAVIDAARRPQRRGDDPRSAWTISSG